MVFSEQKKKNVVNLNFKGGTRSGSKDEAEWVLKGRVTNLWFQERYEERVHLLPMVMQEG